MVDNGEPNLEERARAGDAAAFGALVRTVDADLRRVVWSVVRNAADTDDVMQAAYEKAFRAIGTFDGRSAFRTWLHSVCYRTAIDYVRYESRRDHGVLGEHPHDGDVGLRAVEARIDVAHVFDQLDEEQRVLLMLTLGLGFSYDETAEIVQTQRGTVASKVSRARAKLQAGGSQ